MLGRIRSNGRDGFDSSNTTGVHGVHIVPGSFIQDQIRVVMDDLGADSIKVGMLATWNG